MEQKDTNLLILCKGRIKFSETIGLAAILILIACLYISVFNNTLTNWDDELYILYNPYIKSLGWENLKNIFSTFFAGNYHPLTLLSMAADYQLGGENPWPYQLSNFILHLGNALLVFLFLKALLQLHPLQHFNNTIIPFVAALLFAIHPFHVESVAWISERKNVLYAFFFLMSLIVYTRYLNKLNIKTYTLSVILFFLSLLSKGMAVPLSVCIILIDYFSGRPLLSKKVILEKIPFIMLSIIFGIIAILAQQSGNAIREDDSYSLLERIAISSSGFIQYLIKLCFPHHLSTFYPYPLKSENHLPIYYYSFIFAVAFILFFVWHYFRNNRIILFGSLFFIANICIVLQILPVGDAFMADRYVYIPSIGFFAILGYTGNFFWKKGRLSQKFVITAIAIYCIVLSTKTFHGVSVWKNSLTLWNNALKHYPENNDRGFLNRGNYFLNIGNYPSALLDFERLIQIDPRNSGAYIGMGRIKQALNDLPGALIDFNISLSLQKTYEGYINRSVIKVEQKDFEGAMMDLDSAISINPLRAESYINKGVLLFANNKNKEALQNFNLVMQIDPRNAKAYLGISLAKQATNDKSGALSDLNKLLSFNQSYDGYVNRATLKNDMGDKKGALKDLEIALHLDTSRIEAYNNYGQMHYEIGNYSIASVAFRKVLIKDKKNVKAYLGLAQAMFGIKNIQSALKTLDTLLTFELSYDGLVNRAVLKKELKDYKGALADLDKASELDPLRTGAYLNKGRTLFEMKEFAGAEQNYNRTLQIDSMNSNAHIGKGLIKQALKNYQGALNDFNKAIFLSQSYDGYLNRAVLKMEIQAWDEAWSDLENASQINPSRKETFLNMGIIELNLGRPQNAISEFNKVLDEAGNYQAYLYRGVAKLNLSDFQGALADINSSLQLFQSGEAYYFRGITYLEMKENKLGCSNLKHSLSIGYIPAQQELERNCK